MSARAIRIKKEIRILFWPWLAIVVAGASPLALPHYLAEPINFVSFFIGVPLLATLSLGHEFQQGTFLLWLAQPLSRLQLWTEKLVVMFPAVLSAGLVSGVIMFRVTWPQMSAASKAAGAVYVIVSVASATFWTLAARSTIGGLALISCTLYAGTLFSGGVEHRGEETSLASAAGMISVLFVVGLCFAAAMLWLGARKLVRFQVIGGVSDGDILVNGPSFAPPALADLFRSRPTGAFLNVIRKEFRLLRPLWLISFFVTLYVLGLAIFRLLPAPPLPEPRNTLEWALLGPFVSLCIAMAGLAGILSVGEEKSSGTHAWQLTLPISSGRQWLVKFLLAMLAGLGCSVVLPVAMMILGGAVFGSPLMYVHLQVVAQLVLPLAILTFTCFWCACAANDTLHAAIWAIPATFAVTLASVVGMQLGRAVADASGTLRDLMVSSFHLSPFMLAELAEFARTHVLWLFIPALLVAVFQSYVLFRTPPGPGVRWMLRCLLLPVTVTLLWSFSVYAGFLASRWEPFQETRRALDKYQTVSANREIAGDELQSDAALSASTRRWLAGSTIRIAPGHSALPGYSAMIHLAGDTECQLDVVRGGATSATCSAKKH